MMGKRIKVSFNCRRIPRLDDELSNIHESIKTYLEKLPEPWSAELTGNPNAALGDLIAVCKVGRKGKFSGEVCYALRNENYLRDESQYDDSINLDFLANEDELRYFANEIFLGLISLVGAYRAELTTKDLARSDWREISARTREAGRDIYGRHGVYRVWPLSYYSSSILDTKDSPLFLEPFFEGYMCREIKPYLDDSVANYGKMGVCS